MTKPGRGIKKRVEIVKAGRTEPLHSGLAFEVERIPTGAGSSKTGHTGRKSREGKLLKVLWAWAR